MNKNETPEEKAARLEKHKRLTSYIIGNNFETKVGSLTGETFYECRFCNACLDTERDAMNHYFENHKGLRHDQAGGNQNGEGNYSRPQRRKTFHPRQNEDGHSYKGREKRTRKTWED